MIEWWMNIEPAGVRYFLLVAAFLLVFLIIGLALQIFFGEYGRHLDDE